MEKHDSGFDEASHDDKAIRFCHTVIRFCVKMLALLMTLLIIWGVLDVVYVMYTKLKSPPYFLLSISDILAVFSAFLAVLIAIEIFINIVMYLRDDVIHVNLVIATALMAIARKVIVLDFSKLAPEYIWSTAGLVLALGLTYWLVAVKEKKRVRINE
ncbi:phosphate-starvation-inducible PsiE family protein [Pseudoalteromonas sp.]|uniref:phosphate-starvation-inducible PsiE family protein n=1 Tax=Pseudoalteromonas sp. TaxID=53249 RepID=UPI00356A7D26